MATTTFSQKLKRLEEIVARLESSEVELEEGLKLLEEGVALHKDCQDTLTKSQAKITQLLSNNSPDETAPKQSTQPSGSDSLFDTISDPAETTKDSNNKDDELPF